MSYSKYNSDERKIVHEIYKLERLMEASRKRYLEYDTKRIALVHSLNGKYDSKKRW
jgi:hypothetical protein